MTHVTSIVPSVSLSSFDSDGEEPFYDAEESGGARGGWGGVVYGPTIMPLSLYTVCIVWPTIMPLSLYTVCSVWPTIMPLSLYTVCIVWPTIMPLSLYTVCSVWADYNAPISVYCV